jgi:hypothetical protein
MVFTKFINPAHDHAWHAQTIFLFESLLVPQSAQFLFQTEPEPHKMPALTQPGLQADCFTHPSTGRRVPFEAPCHFWCLYLSLKLTSMFTWKILYMNDWPSIHTPYMQSLAANQQQICMGAIMKMAAWRWAQVLAVRKISHDTCKKYQHHV